MYPWSQRQKVKTDSRTYTLNHYIILHSFFNFLDHMSKNQPTGPNAKTSLKLSTISNQHFFLPLGFIIAGTVFSFEYQSISETSYEVVVIPNMLKFSQNLRKNQIFFQINTHMRVFFFYSSHRSKKTWSEGNVYSNGGYQPFF